MPLLPRLSRSLEKIADMQKLRAILLEAEAEAPPDSNGRVLRRSADGHNRDRRRGLPMISRGVGGASPGTDPVAALIAKERRGELWRSERRDHDVRS